MIIHVSLLPDFFAVAALLTLAFYHFNIYWGRRKEFTETYNLYFSLFIGTVAFLVIVPQLQPKQMLHFLKPNWLYVLNIEALLSWFLLIFGIKFLSHLFQTPESFNRRFKLSILLLFLNVLLTLTANFIGLQFYFKYIMPVIMVSIILNTVFILWSYGNWMIKNKLFSVTFYKIFFIGFVALIFNILVYRSIELLSQNHFLVFNHFISACILYFFAFVISTKYNTEYFELKELRFSLNENFRSQPNFNVTEEISETENLKIPESQVRLKTIKTNNIQPTETQIASMDEKFLMSAVKVVESNMSFSEMSSEQFCSEIGMSRASVHRKMKALTGQSTSHFIRTIRLKKAAELLNQRAATVSEIAYLTGFNNLSYFTKSFKEEFGNVPSEYCIENRSVIKVESTL